MLPRNTPKADLGYHQCREQPMYLLGRKTYLDILRLIDLQRIVESEEQIQVHGLGAFGRAPVVCLDIRSGTCLPRPWSGLGSLGTYLPHRQPLRHTFGNILGVRRDDPHLRVSKRVLTLGKELQAQLRR